MHYFKDKRGNEWELSLTLGVANRVEASDFSEVFDGEVSLLEMPQGEFASALVSNVPLIFSLIWCSVKIQADKIGVNQEEFAELLNQQAITDAKDAFWRELADFYPTIATVLLSHADGYLAMSKKIESLVNNSMSKVNLEKKMNQIVEEQMKGLPEMLNDAIDGTLSTESLASSVSIGEN